MRGKGALKEQMGENVGITPAYAGKSVPSLRILLSCKDHPRLCGEKCKASAEA